MDRLFWWIRQTLLVAGGCFFLFFGVHILIAAYRLNDPFDFVMTFFASNLIILISAVLVLGFILRMIKMYKDRGEEVV
ncbi:MAG: hypothetical protein DRH37_02730 [Deltaproteobacteria bacterium]|nr:MAG: hypothetical protein DRH37_02730 [Deltaproteobacteria bacterium]